ncbi:hypothetical protein Dsin_006696 [Dipteronia sinensis]|uniref:BZIP domain-containing protein n=1 Tax=Dipteronia sinensis TaxID=43782 RepID=A0AAE0B0E6_9ROSI|nr:hypothetical protein Dsin_006696 [Dipteronia sinensis]
MVIPEPDDNISQGEVESLLQCDQQQQMNQPILSSLGRQASIYSLTLDEFQHTICEEGKNFWSMNMDEFLTSIWNAEEGINYTVNTTTNNIIVIDDNNNNNSVLDDNNNSAVVDNQAMQLSLNEAIISSTKGIARQQSLARATLLALPAPLCLKTVDEVWSEIHRGVQDHGQQQQQQQNNNTTNLENNSKLVVQNSETITRQTTFGHEMTLEDFLIKAGIVREQTTIPVQQQQHTTQQLQQQFGMQQQQTTTQQQQQPPQQQPTTQQQQQQQQPTTQQQQEQPQQQPTTQQELQQQFGMYQSANNPGNMSLSFPTRPVILMPNGGGAAVVGPPYQAMPNSCSVMVEPSMYSQQQQQQLQPVCYGGRVGNGGGYGSGQPMGMVAAPLSPATSEGMCGISQQQQVDITVNQFGVDMGGQRGKKRILESGTVEKVVERRQRRMIKNRESAARSRARKQAYTVELEAELNNLKEENNNLKQALVMCQCLYLIIIITFYGWILVLSSVDNNFAFILYLDQEEIENNRKQQLFEELELRACTRAQKTKDKMRSLRKNLSCLM